MESSIELLSELFEEGPVVIFQWENEANWPVNFVSENVKELTGYTSEEWIEQKVKYSDIIHPEDLPRVVEEVQLNSYQLKQKKWKHKPYRLIKKNGEEVWVQDYTICKYKNDIPIIYIGYIFDITKEYNLQKKLESELELYFSFFEKHNAVMLIIDPTDGKIINANESASKFYGYSKKQLQNMYIHDINSLSKEEIQFRMQQAKLKKQNFFLFKHKLANGRIKDVEVYSTPIVFNSKTLLFSIIHDISDKIQVEENLKQLQNNLENLLEKQIQERIKIYKKYQLLFEQNYLGIGIVQNNELIEYNQKLAQLLKPLSLQNIKKDFFSIFDLSSEIDIHKILLSYQKTNYYEVKLKVDPHKLFLLVVIPFQNWESEEKINFLIFLSDITESKKMELEKKEKEEMLIHQSKLAAIGESLTAIAHQWKQPLHSLQLMASYLKETCLNNTLSNEIVLSIANDLIGQIQFLNQTLKDFRDFYKENIKKNQVISIKSELEKILKIFKVQFDNHNITLEIKGNDFSIIGNENLFKHIILNLINNAKDAILEKQKSEIGFRGKIQIELNAEKKILKIIDNGIGIPKEIQKKLFLPYVTTKKTEGSGLGLYITKQILNKINADIYFIDINEEDKKTTFVIKFR